MNHCVWGAGRGNWGECTWASAKLGNRSWENSDKCLMTVLGRVRAARQEKGGKGVNNVEGEVGLAGLCASPRGLQRKQAFQSLSDVNI